MSPLTYEQISSALRHENGRLFWRINSGGVKALRVEAEAKKEQP